MIDSLSMVQVAFNCIPTVLRVADVGILTRAPKELLVNGVSTLLEQGMEHNGLPLLVKETGTLI